MKKVVEVKPELIRWARERSGFDVPALVEIFPKYQLWESGEAKPTFLQLNALAKKTMSPLGYFFLQSPPEEKLPIPDFRTMRDAVVKRPSPNLFETVQTMQRRQHWMRDFLIEEGEHPLPFIGSVNLKADFRKVAEDTGGAKLFISPRQTSREIRQRVTYSR